MTIPGPGPPEAHHRVAAVKRRGVTNTGAGIGDQGGLVTPTYGALIGLGASWRAQPIDSHKKKTLKPLIGLLTAGLLAYDNRAVVFLGAIDQLFC